MFCAVAAAVAIFTTRDKREEREEERLGRVFLIDEAGRRGPTQVKV